MAVLKIGGFSSPGHLTDFSALRADIDSDATGRGEDGIMTRERVRQGVLSIQFTYRMLETQDANELIGALAEEEIKVESIAGNATMYSGDRTISMVTGGRDGGKPRWDISGKLVEY